MDAKKLFIKFEKCFFYINFFFAALLVFSYLASIISPERFWPLAFLGLIYPILIYTNLLFVIYWVIRRRKFFFISFVTILIGLNVLLNTIGFSFSDPAKSRLPAAHLKLMTYNVHNFQSIINNKPADKAMLKLIDLNQPDIIGFEEFYSQYTRFNICDSLKRMLHFNQFYFEPFNITRYDSTGLALFSKYPIINKGVVKLSSEQDNTPGIFIDITYQSRVVRIYCFHLKSLRLDPPDPADNSLINPSRLKEIFTKLKAAFIIRAQQVNLIRNDVAKCPYPYIFLGDFNDTPSSYAFNQMSKGMKNAFKERGSGIGKTFNGSFASFQIDYILASQQFDIFNYGVIQKEISDHFPVYSEVGLK